MQKCVICGSKCTISGTITCSTTCHDQFVSNLENEFGKFKKVVRESTGVAYKVPLRDIIEKGIQEQSLDQYPLWEGAHA